MNENLRILPLNISQTYNSHINYLKVGQCGN